MGLAVMGEYLLYFRVELHPVFPACLFDYMPSSERLDGSLEQFVGLQSHNEFVFPVYVAGCM